MKKLVFLLAIAVTTFACNSSDKPKEESADVQEIKAENLIEVSITTHGMTCEGCENAIKKSVNSLEGIAEVAPSHMDSVTVVKFDKSQTSQEAIEGKIADAGYTVVH